MCCILKKGAKSAKTNPDACIVRHRGVFVIKLSTLLQSQELFGALLQGGVFDFLEVV